MAHFLGYRLVLSALLAVSFAGRAPGAAPAGTGGHEPDKPLGTLWYPGPYQAPAPAESPPSVPAPAESPQAPAGATPVGFQAPAPVAPQPGAPQPGKPLGTLWYPGAYDPNKAKPKTLPAPVIAPEPAPRRSQPLPPLDAAKPLGTLWYPGAYDPNIPSRPVPAPVTTTRAAKPIPVQTPAPVRPLPAPRPLVKTAPAPRPSAGPPTPITAPAKAPETDGADISVHLSADEMNFDQEKGLVTAIGNIEIIHEGRRLLADRIIYDQKTGVVSAFGNVQLLEPGGEKIFGEQMQISGDLKDAVIKGIGIILTDRARIAASGARLSGGVTTEMRQGVYSPCNLCKDDPDRPPLWQIKAVKIIHDKNSRTIEYRDAWLEIMGFPVAYTPYLSHPDPTVKRESGLLVPSFGNSSDLGFIAQLPYFYNISPTSDATITALITGQEGSGAIGEYRRRFLNGTLEATASLVGGDSEEDVRGHIDAEGRFDIDDTWRWGFDLNRATDDTYLRRYGFSSPASLNTRIFAEGFRDRNYFSANGYAFQGLRSTDDSDLEPLVLPLVDFNHLSAPDRFGGQTVLDVSFLAIARDGGTDTRRLSIRPGWQLPFKGPLGDVYMLSLSLNTDLYQVDHLARTQKPEFSGVSGRIVPQIMLDWRFPFVRNEGSVSQVIEPIAAAFYSPYGGNSNKIPNEDSTELEFDDTNLFSANKFSGLDRVEGGPRISYGLKWGLYGKGGGSTNLFVGQSWRPRSDDTFAANSGLEENFSDLVGRVHITPGPYLNLIYRTRLAADNFTPKRNEVSFDAGVPAFRVNANYVFIEQQADSEFSGREEINLSLQSQLNKYWRTSFSGIRDLATDELRTLGASLVYENECVIFTTKASRSFFQDRDLTPTDQVTVNIVFKTLGEIRTNIYQR